MAVSITGEALYALLLAADSGLAYTWRDLNTYDKQIYVEVATALNGTYLAPLQGQVQVLDTELRTIQDACRETFNRQAQQIQALQGLVMQWQQLMEEHEEVDVMSIAEIDDWHKAWQELKQRTAELLNVEQKEEGK